MARNRRSAAVRSSLRWRFVRELDCDDGNADRDAEHPGMWRPHLEKIDEGSGHDRQSKAKSSDDQEDTTGSIPSHVPMALRSVKASTARMTA